MIQAVWNSPRRIEQKQQHKIQWGKTNGFLASAFFLSENLSEEEFLKREG